MPDQPKHSHRHDHSTELEKLLRRITEWFQSNGTAVIYGLAVILAIAAAIVWWNKKPPGNLQASEDLFKAQYSSPGSADTDSLTFQDVADAFPDTQIGIWARLRQAEERLAEGINSMFQDRKRASEQLDDAESALDRLRGRSDADDAVQERVLIGLARLAEARCDGQQETTDAAIAAWENLVKTYPDTIAKKLAEERIEKLSEEEPKSFYAWFAKVDPAAAAENENPPESNVPDIPPSGGNVKEATPSSDGNNGEPSSPAASDSTEPDKKAGNQKEEAATPDSAPATEKTDSPQDDNAPKDAESSGASESESGDAKDGESAAEGESNGNDAPVENEDKSADSSTEKSSDEPPAGEGEAK